MAASGAELAREAARLLASSEYMAAERLSQCAVLKMRGENDPGRLAKVLNNLGASRLYQQDFAGAFEAFQEAGSLAQRLGLAEAGASVWSNLATLYGMLLAWPAAEQSLDRALALMPETSRYRTALLAQKIRLLNRRPGASEEELLRLWREAMDEAERFRDWQVQRHLWDELAEFYLRAGRPEAAEPAIANSFRLVTLHRLTDPDSLWILAGRLRQAQGRPREALGWLRKVRAGWTGYRNPVSALRLATEEAKAEAAAHGAGAALAACRRNWPRVAGWRRAVLPDPQVELASDVAMTEVADQYAGAALAGQAGAGRSAEAWAVVEQSRALGLLRQRRRIAAARRRSGGQGGSARVVLAAHIRDGGAGEAGSDGLDAAGSPESLRLLPLVQRNLNARQALFCFWLGRERSLLWAVTNTGFAMAELAPGAALLQRFREFREAVEAGGDAGGLAGRLYAETFGRAPEEARRRPEWLISADEVPLTMPLAALRVPEENHRYLGEARALTFVPSALWLLERDREAPPRTLLAVGGLVHNSADARWNPAASPRGAGPGGAPGNARRQTRRVPDVEFPSLPGSGREVAAISSFWERQGLRAARLEGLDATERAVEEATRRGVTDLHFATHVQPAPAPRAYQVRAEPDSPAPVLIRFPSGEPFLALSLGRDGRRAGIGARELHRLRLEGVRVVLNGCSTAGGVAQKGAGLSSFATAWLAAGAGSVIASLWPVDDDGTFFEAYYRALLGGSRPAAALHAAQAAMIGSGSWRALPRYWAAYIHLGKD